MAYSDDEYLERIQKQRHYWMTKSQTQLGKVYMASLDQNSTLHDALIEDLTTSLICLWRFDGKLQDLRNSSATSNAGNGPADDVDLYEGSV